jgi:hypothetical protein
MLVAWNVGGFHCLLERADWSGAKAFCVQCSALVCWLVGWGLLRCADSSQELCCASSSR